MRVLKRTVTGIVAVMLCMALLLTGCGENKAADSGNEKDLVWYMIGTAPTDLDMVMEEVSKITKEKIGVGVKMYQVANADYARKIQTMLNSGEEFDLCFINMAQVDNMRKGNFVELSELLKNQGKGYA